MMTINPISAATLGESVLASGNSTQLQQSLQALQQSLNVGDLDGAQSAFQTLQQLNQSLVTASGNNSSNASQLSTDLTSLGSALTSGDLTTAQSAFTTVQSDLKSATSPSLTVETNLASESVRLVQGLLSPLNSSSSSSSSPNDTASLLDAVYGSSGGIDVRA
jgi:hypothetical protein